MKMESGGTKEVHELDGSRENVNIAFSIFY
jgi:hypothetical protein